MEEGACVVHIDWHSNPITVLLTDGRRFACDKLVLTPGPWANKVFRLVDLQLPLRVCVYKRIDLILYFILGSTTNHRNKIIADIGSLDI